MIVSNKRINGGKPTIAGTRVSVWSILQAVSIGISLSDIATRLNKSHSRNEKFTGMEVGKIIQLYSNKFL